jgi:acetate kinase
MEPTSQTEVPREGLPPTVLVLNVGSSTLKFALFQGSSARSRGSLEIVRSGGTREIAAAVRGVMALVGRTGLRPDLVGHRLVHGGPQRFRPALWDEALAADLRAAVPFAPLHLPAELAVLEEVAAVLPETPQLACFDTAFHRTMPLLAARYALPTRFFEQGLRRYGFHGLSYEHATDTLGEDLGQRVVLAHLGNGASLAAVLDGVCIDTTMGFSPAGGVVMGTRVGDLDPGLLVHLLRTEHLDADGLDDLVNRQGGLLAISETSSDLRTLLASEATDPRAALALGIWCYEIRKRIGGFAAALGGLDRLVFTGGAGAFSGALRARICEGLGHLGVTLDERRNREADHADPAAPVDIEATGGACSVTRLVADEERVIARAACAWLAQAASGTSDA